MTESKIRERWIESLQKVLLNIATQKPQTKKALNELCVNDAQAIVAVRVVARLLGLEL